MDRHSLQFTMIGLVLLASLVGCGAPMTAPTPIIIVVTATPDGKTPLVPLTAAPTETRPTTAPATIVPTEARPTATSTGVPTPIPTAGRLTSLNTPSTTDSTIRLQLLAFELLGTPCAYKENGYHAALWDLQRWQDRIYLAHGDWFINSGPLRLIYYDLQADNFIHDEKFMLDEDGMEHFRLYGDTLYIPGSDATESWGFGNFYFKKWGESWVKMRTIPGAIHIWDIALLDETLVAIGQQDHIGALWVSSDGGQTWKDGPDFQAEEYSMPMSGFVLGTKLFVTTVGTGCLVFDGRSWEPTDCLASNIFEGTAAVQKYATFQEVVAMAPYWSTIDHRLHFFDGQSRWTVEFPEPVHDVITAEGSLFVLTGDSSGKGAIYTASNLECHCGGDFARIVDFNFEDKAFTPPEDEFLRLTGESTPHSLEFAMGRFYIGLADGRLFQSAAYQP